MTLFKGEGGYTLMIQWYNRDCTTIGYTLTVLW